jgi:hypothetical protein
MARVTVTVKDEGDPTNMEVAIAGQRLIAPRVVGEYKSVVVRVTPIKNKPHAWAVTFDVLPLPKRGKRA